MYCVMSVSAIEMLIMSTWCELIPFRAWSVRFHRKISGKLDGWLDLRCTATYDLSRWNQKGRAPVWASWIPSMYGFSIAICRWDVAGVSQSYERLHGCWLLPCCDTITSDGSWYSCSLALKKWVSAGVETEGNQEEGKGRCQSKMKKCIEMIYDL